MELIRSENGIILCGEEHFDPFMSCECGQCFRFEKRNNDEYSLIAHGRELVIRRDPCGWLFCGTDEEEFRSVWESYFDLDRDYGAIIKGFSGDAKISEAAGYASGIRIFRQDAWETLISFIISQNNNIPRIKKIISALCALLGEKSESGIYSFPTAESIASSGIEGLAPIRSGFRAKYIIDAAEKVLSGEVELERIAKGSYEDGLAELKRIKGVGDKVANCVLLFGFGFCNAFPIDVWMKKVIDRYYGGSFDISSLGGYAGIAQQYLFYFERSTSDGKGE